MVVPGRPGRLVKIGFDKAVFSSGCGPRAMSVLQVIPRVDRSFRSFQNFFRPVKSGAKPELGPPPKTGEL